MLRRRFGGYRAHNVEVAAARLADAGIALADRQFQLWSTPHGVIKGALANNATVQGRTISFAVPRRFSAKAFLDDLNLRTLEELPPLASQAAEWGEPIDGDARVELLNFLSR